MIYGELTEGMYAALCGWPVADQDDIDVHGYTPADERDEQ